MFTPENLFMAFIGLSALILVSIIVLSIPDMFRFVAKSYRQTKARRDREERMLADLEQLDADADNLEGLCLFDSELVVKGNHKGSRPTQETREKAPFADL